MTLLATVPATELVAPEAADLELSESTLARLRRAPAANTTAAYEWQWARFVAWCAQHRRQTLPATAQTLTEYTAALCDGGYAPSTVEQAIATIRTRHRRAGHRGHPDTEGALDVLRTHRRDRAERGDRDREARPVTVAALRQMLGACDPSRAIGLRDRALLVLGFSMMARRSELVALRRDDVRETENGLEVRVRKSKTDQEARGRRVNLPRGQWESTDPVRVWRAWTDVLDVAGLDNGYLFRSVSRWDALGEMLQGRAVAEVVRTAATTVELPEPGTYSAHSLRAGGATEAYRAGAPVTAICDHGGWKRGSPVVLGYIRAVDAWRDNAMLGVGL